MEWTDLAIVAIGIFAVLAGAYLSQKYLERQANQRLLGELAPPPSFPAWPQTTAERAHELHAMPYRDYLETPEWKQRSRLMRQRAGWRCEQCGSETGVQTHHLTYRRRGYERPTDLQVLCRECHRRAHNRRRKSSPQ